mmetsp:Transcript_41964/g.90111  ORF Transcript_41964/g.90111 Transcript_41964/m.90111 type:complete len:258 (+) Transcript_41964:287-1060(+)
MRKPATRQLRLPTRSSLSLSLSLQVIIHKEKKDIHTPTHRQQEQWNNSCCTAQQKPYKKRTASSSVLVGSEHHAGRQGNWWDEVAEARLGLLCDCSFTHLAADRVGIQSLHECLGHLLAAFAAGLDSIHVVRGVLSVQNLEERYWHDLSAVHRDLRDRVVEAGGNRCLKHCGIILVPQRFQSCVSPALSTNFWVIEHADDDLLGLLVGDQALDVVLKLPAIDVEEVLDAPGLPPEDGLWGGPMHNSQHRRDRDRGRC